MLPLLIITVNWRSNITPDHICHQVIKRLRPDPLSGTAAAAFDSKTYQNTPGALIYDKFFRLDNKNIHVARKMNLII